MERYGVADAIIQGEAVVLSKVTLHLAGLANEKGLKVFAKADLTKETLSNKRAELVNWATVRWLKEGAK